VWRTVPKRNLAVGLGTMLAADGAVLAPSARQQAALYEQAVRELGEALEQNDGIARKGIVLAMLMRFKQICNHPSHWLNDNIWAERDSGKFVRL
jgi:non-specific serine/threonine protein kinase